MPHTRFSRLAGDSLDLHRDADSNLIVVVVNAIRDHQITHSEATAIEKAIAMVRASVAPLVGYVERQDQAFRVIQLISNTGGMTRHVDEQLRSMAADREILPVPEDQKGVDRPVASGRSTSGDAAKTIWTR